MLKKNIVLVIFLVAAGLAVVQAQETVADETPVTAVFPQYGTGQMFNLTPMAYPSGFGGRLGIGFLNIFFGLGSWISGDWWGGLKIGLFEACGMAAVIWSRTWDPNVYLFIIPIIVPVGGVIFWVSGILYGFIAPQTAQLNDLRNWTVAVFPTPDKRVAGTLAFTAHL
jgi:hypothetical protein